MKWWRRLDPVCLRLSAMFCCMECAVYCHTGFTVPTLLVSWMVSKACSMSSAFCVWYSCLMCSDLAFVNEGSVLSAMHSVILKWNERYLSFIPSHRTSQHSFWLIFTARRYAKRGICRHRVSMCLSHSGIVSKWLNVGSQIMPHDSPMTLVFWYQRSWRNSNGITPCGGDKCRWGGLKFAIFDEKRAITRKRYKIDL